VLAISRSIDARFNALRSHLNDVDQRLSLQISTLREASSVADASGMSRLEHLEYRVNANRELIDHRTERFEDYFSRVEASFQAQITEVKGYLQKTTDFQVRQ
jgi:uncharacterized protein YfaS (alpha-2-macroglobulin family)